MEIDSKGNVEEIGSIAAKEHVLAMYPSSRTIYTGYEWQIWAEEDGKTYQWSKLNYDIHPATTVELAWEHAWERIQRRMIRKLES